MKCLIFVFLMSSSFAWANAGDIKCNFSLKGATKNESFSRTIALDEGNWYNLGDMLVQVQAIPLEDKTLGKIFTKVTIDIQNSNDLETFKVGFRSDGMASKDISATASYRNVLTNIPFVVDEYSVGCLRETK